MSETTKRVPPAVINIRHLQTRFGDTIVHDNLNFRVQRGESVAIVGGSGAGKTTLLRAILRLHADASGSIKVLGHELINGDSTALHEVRKRWGVMFQQGALFSSLTVLENVTFPLFEYNHLKASTVKEIAMLKIAMANFPLESVHKYPAELSGGMVKRAALARAMVMDPEILFLDEPTAGLDPESASALDELIIKLQTALGLTIVMVTHDLDTLKRVVDRIAFLGEKRVIASGTMQELSQSRRVIVREYFDNVRAKAALQVEE